MKKELIKLGSGCERTAVFVSPRNYLSFTAKSDFPKNWFVECRFHDPKFRSEYPQGFQYRRKFSGNDLQVLKLTAKIYKEEMEDNLDNKKYNPITKLSMHGNASDINPRTNFVQALWLIRDKVPFSNDYKALSKQLSN